MKQRNLRNGQIFVKSAWIKEKLRGIVKKILPDKCCRIYRTWSGWWCWFCQRIDRLRIPACISPEGTLSPFFNFFSLFLLVNESFRSESRRIFFCCWNYCYCYYYIISDGNGNSQDRRKWRKALSLIRLYREHEKPPTHNLWTGFSFPILPLFNYRIDHLSHWKVERLNGSAARGSTYLIEKILGLRF